MILKHSTSFKPQNCLYTNIKSILLNISQNFSFQRKYFISNILSYNTKREIMTLSIQVDYSLILSVLDVFFIWFSFSKILHLNFQIS